MHVKNLRYYIVYLQTFTVAILKPLGATSRVIFELKPFGVSIMGANGSQPWVGRSTAQMSGNPIMYMASAVEIYSQL